MMGAYWAYETLNFGGYWNWDPVENAVYVPWLFLVASLHSIILAQKNKNYIKTSLILSIISFILILYSTFLQEVVFWETAQSIHLQIWV